MAGYLIHSIFKLIRCPVVTQKSIINHEKLSNAEAMGIDCTYERKIIERMSLLN